MKRGRVAHNGAIHQVIEADGQVQFADGSRLPEDQVLWLPPVEARTIFALGLNYADHARELAFKPPEVPLVFTKGPGSLIGHRARTIRPPDAAFMHYECELAVIIGQTARHVPHECAYDVVAGYAVANDYAIRDYLENYYRPNLRVKNRDGCTPIGPWLVDRADIPDPMNLTLTTRINGVETQRGTTRDMIFDIPALIAYLSGIQTLLPGDIILTGTPEGLSNVQPGDVVTTEIETIGSLINSLIAPTEIASQGAAP